MDHLLTHLDLTTANFIADQEVDSILALRSTTTDLVVVLEQILTLGIVLIVLEIETDLAMPSTGLMKTILVSGLIAEGEALELTTTEYRQ